MKGNKTISFINVQNSNETDKKNNRSRSILKITGAHVNRNVFQKICVTRLVAQLFSHIMVATIVRVL